MFVVRSCGQVFCGECSDYSLPVPQQHLDKPVRVCIYCYRQSTTASSDIPSAATANPSDTVNGGPKSVFGHSYVVWLLLVSVQSTDAVCFILQLYKIILRCKCRQSLWCRFVQQFTENIYNANYDDSHCRPVNSCPLKHRDVFLPVLMMVIVLVVTSCYTNGCKRPHCCGLMPLLHTVGCVWWAWRLDTSIVQVVTSCPPSKVPLPMGISPPSNTWFIGPTQVCPPAICARLMVIVAHRQTTLHHDICSNCPHLALLSLLEIWANNDCNYLAVKFFSHNWISCQSTYACYWAFISLLDLATPFEPVEQLVHYSLYCMHLHLVESADCV